MPNDEIVPTKKVLKITEDMDPREVYCTTYQMRDIWSQLSSAMVGSLDIMSLHMHHYATLMLKPGDKVLDVCCGRCMILPMIRRLRPNIACYVGVDIEQNNMNEALRRSAGSSITGRKIAPNLPGAGEPYYPFPLFLVSADAADMYEPLHDSYKLAPFDKIIYTASVEHMQKEAGIKSLAECYRLLRPKAGKMFLTSPNTEDKDDPYDTQYAAHLYEWSREELKGTCEGIGFRVEAEFGLTAKVRGYKEKLFQHYPHLVKPFQAFEEYLPSAWLYSIFPIITPTIADEVAFVLTRA